jgi:hypothetical protein
MTVTVKLEEEETFPKLNKAVELITWEPKATQVWIKRSENCEVTRDFERKVCSSTTNGAGEVN